MSNLIGKYSRAKFAYVFKFQTNCIFQICTASDFKIKLSKNPSSIDTNNLLIMTIIIMIIMAIYNCDDHHNHQTIPGRVQGRAQAHRRNRTSR